jgi:predicted acylesterase/phospholipase RssA
MPPETIEFDRNAVITIQGGGLHALNLLGQLEAIMELRLAPLALAGTSAGAIVATLLWARLSPAAARDRIVAMAPLVQLLGPFAAPPRKGFGFRELRRLVDDFKSLLGGRSRAADPPPGMWRRLWAPVKVRFQRCTQASRLLWTAATLAQHIQRRGLFAGDELERQMDLILRSAPDFVKYRHELSDLKEWPDRVRFRHFRHLADAHPAECYRPPLFLTATNLTSRRLELFNSVDDDSQSVAVASAVRASAGFPLFFTPTRGIEGGWYVDGGVVSNFPAWVFTHEFRRRMDAEPRFAGLSMSPWVHIGLRIVDDPLPYEALEEPVKYLGSLLDMLIGQSRNVLEELLAERMPHLLLINQPVSTTAAPVNSLEFDKVGRAVIHRMFDAGRDHARKALASLSFALPAGDDATALTSELRRLTSAAERIFPNTPPIRFRANIFIPMRDTLVLRYSFNMDNDPDRHMELARTGGLAGACYTTRCPLICNLTKVRERAVAGRIDSKSLFNMTPEQQAQVEPHRTWLASVPIFDPFDSTTVPRRGGDSTRRFGYHYYQLGSLVDGAVLGVLNLDADWSYEKIDLQPDPEAHFADPRIQDILDLMQAACMRVGSLLGSYFGGDNRPLATLGEAQQSLA